jgi:hypothetical protein
LRCSSLTIRNSRADGAEFKDQALIAMPKWSIYIMGHTFILILCYCEYITCSVNKSLGSSDWDSLISLRIDCTWNQRRTHGHQTNTLVWWPHPPLNDLRFILLIFLLLWGSCFVWSYYWYNLSNRDRSDGHQTNVVLGHTYALTICSAPLLLGSTSNSSDNMRIFS